MNLIKQTARLFNPVTYRQRKIQRALISAFIIAVVLASYNYNRPGVQGSSCTKIRIVPASKIPKDVPSGFHYPPPKNKSSPLHRCWHRRNVPTLPFREVRNATKIEDQDLFRISARLHILRGGQSFPTDARCASRIRTALVVPCRDQDGAQLRTFLWYMHQFLFLQRVNYTIFVVGQRPNRWLNRGKLFNVGFLQSQLLDKEFDCYIFHDVDLLPENLDNIYSCSHQPRYMVSVLDDQENNLIKCELSGGAVAVLRRQFEEIGGFSNRFYSWGTENDDLKERISAASYSITLWDPNVARYTTMVQENQTSDQKMFKSASYRRKKDGLGNIKYKRLRLEKLPFYTEILVET